MNLDNYKSQINQVDFKSDGNDQEDVTSKVLANAKLDEMNTKLQKGTISQEDFDNFFNQVQALMKNNNADITKINGEFEKAKNDIIKKSAQAIKDGKQETIVTGTFKKLFYFPLGVNEDLGKNNEFQNYSKGVIDELMALPEVVELLATNSQARAQLIEAFKNLSWEQIKNSFHISLDNAYEAGRATVFTVLMLSGIGALLKTGSKLIGKIAKAQPIKPVAPGLTGKAAEEASKLKAMGEKPKTPGLADAGTAEVRGILNKAGKLTPDELTKLDTRRALLNKEASTSGVAPKRLEAINKEVNLIESKIRGSQSGMNGAADSARVFEQSSPKTVTDKLKSILTSLKGGEKIVKLKESIKATIKDISKDLDDAKGALKEAKKSKDPDLIESAKSKVDQLTIALKEAKKALKAPENFIDRPIKYGLITATLVAAHLERGTRIDASDELLLSEGSDETPSAPTAPAPTAPAPTAPAPTAPSAPSSSASQKNKFDLSGVSPVMDESLQGKKGEVNVSSLLNIRNESGKIVGNMKKGEEVTLTGNKKEANGTTFVEIASNKYVALNYLTLKTQSPVLAAPASVGSQAATVSTAAPAAPTPAPTPAPAEVVTPFHYSDLKNAIENFNDNENKFLFPTGVQYFGDNTVEGKNNAKTGFALKKGNQDFRIDIESDGTIWVGNTTGVEYSDIRDKVEFTKQSSPIVMQGNQFDFSRIIL